MKKILCKLPSGDELLVDEHSIGKTLGFTYLTKPKYDHRDTEIKIKLLSKKFHKISSSAKQYGLLFQDAIYHNITPRISIRWMNDRIGYGVFAEEAIAKGIYVGEYTGVITPKRDFLHLNNYLHRHPLQEITGEYYAIDAEQCGNETRFINHGDAPNLAHTPALAENQYRKVFFALRHIDKGEQLLYDYGKSYWNIRETPVTFFE